MGEAKARKGKSGSFIKQEVNRSKRGRENFIYIWYGCGRTWITIYIYIHLYECVLMTFVRSCGVGLL